MDQDGPQRVTTFAQQEYDANGSMTVETSYNAGGTVTGTKMYQWDLRGRMTGFDANGNNSLADSGDVVYRYDAVGLRISAITTAQTTRFVQDALNPSGYSQILEERNASNTPTRSYSVGLNQIAQAAGSTVNFYLNDAQQSVRTLTDTDGLPTDTYDYEAFGTVYAPTGGTDNNYKFQGEYIDPITGLSDNRARWLRLGEGRFLSTDPTIFGPGDIGDANLHLYGGANPVFNSDPSGLFFNLPGILALVGKIGGLIVGWSEPIFKGLRVKQAVEDLSDAYTSFHTVLGALADGVDEADIRFITKLIYGAVVGAVISSTESLVISVAGSGALSFLRSLKAARARGLKVTKETLANTRTWVDGIKQKFPDGVHHSQRSVTFKDGWPDFTKSLYPGNKGTVSITLTGSRALNRAAANAKAGFAQTPTGYVWHHHQDLGVMQLVKEDVHSAVRHTGGAGLWAKLHGFESYGS